MDLNDAINSHTDWKIRLRHAISERATLDVASVARDDACDYGQWLHGPARQRFGTLPDRLLGAGSAYALASRAAVLAIEALKRHIAGAAG